MNKKIKYLVHVINSSLNMTLYGKSSRLWGGLELEFYADRNDANREEKCNN